MEICPNCSTWRGAKEPLIVHQTESLKESYCCCCGWEEKKISPMTYQQKKEYIESLRVADRKALKKDKNNIPQLKSVKNDKKKVA